MTKYVQLLVAFMSVLLVSGCATLADAKAGKGSGTVAIYDKGYDEVWDATVETINSLDIDLVSENKEKGELLAQNSMSAFSYGENVAIFVEEVDGKIKTRVEVVNKRALATNITAADWESTIINRLNDRLK